MINYRKNNQNYVNKFFESWGIILIFLILTLIFSLLNPNFTKSYNLTNILKQSSINGILAIGMTFVILTGGIDLSVGALMSITSITTSIFMTSGVNIAVSILAGILISTTFGLINGLLISKFNLQPFFATLLVMSIVSGITASLISGSAISGLPESFLYIGKESITVLNLFNIPILFLSLLLIYGISQFILSYTRYGRFIFAIGNNENSAFISGVNTKAIKISVYVISGFLASISSILLTSRLTVGLSFEGKGYQFDSIAAVIIGGTSFLGGKGRLWGTLVGVLILTVISNGMDLLSIGSFYQQIAKGIILLIAILFDSCKKNKT